MDSHSVTQRSSEPAVFFLFSSFMNGPYADHILDASDVCSNCFRTVRVERLDPTRNGFAGELESHFERRKQNTIIGYGPAESVTDIKGVFCECGVEGAHERLWDPTGLDEAELKELIKNAIRTLRRKEVALKPKETAAYILHVWSETDDVDRAMSKGVEMGVVAQAAANRDEHKTDEKRMQG